MISTFISGSLRRAGMDAANVAHVLSFQGLCGTNFRFAGRLWQELPTPTGRPRPESQMRDTGPSVILSERRISWRLLAVCRSQCHEILRFAQDDRNEKEIVMAIRRPLDGMRVLALWQIYNGPYCGLTLGFMGARVLKIEPPEGDVVRRRKREVEPWPLVMLNSNKESVVLDLKQPRGRELFLELVAKADGLIENFAVGVMDRLGIGWDVPNKIKPRLVYARTPGFSTPAPHPHLPPTVPPVPS